MVTFLAKGGIMMIPIIMTMWVGIYLLIERYRFIKRVARSLKHLPDVQGHQSVSDCPPMKSEGDVIETFYTQAVLAQTLSKNAFENRLKELFYEVHHKLHRNLGTLQTIAVVLPMLGLLGTVTGMISVFKAIAVVGVGDPQALSSGISEALITTQTGLGAAIPILFGHHVLEDRTEAIETTVKQLGMQFLIKKTDHV